MPSQQPEAWDLPQTVGISATIGLAGVCSTMFLLYLAGGAGQPAWGGREVPGELSQSLKLNY